MQNTNAAATEATRQEIGIIFFPQGQTVQQETPSSFGKKMKKPFEWFTLEDKKVPLNTKSKVMVGITDRQVKGAGNVIVTLLKKGIDMSQLPDGFDNSDFQSEPESGISFTFSGKIREGKASTIEFNGFNISKDRIISIHEKETRELIW